MTQFTQCFCFNLADTFSCYIELFTYFFQCSCSAVFQTKTQAQNLFLSVCQCIQNFHQLFFQQSESCCFCRRRDIIIGDEVTQMAVFFFADRCFQRNGFLCDLHDFTYFFLRHLHFLCQFFCGRFTAQFLQQLSGNADEFVDCFYHMHRDTDGSCLIGNGTSDGLSDPPCCICGEFKAFMEVEFFNGFDQTQVTFLNQIQEQHTTANISFCDTYYQTQVCFCQFFLRRFAFRAAFFHFSCQFDFFFCCQQRNFTDFFQVHTHGVVDVDTFGQCQVEFFFDFFFRFNIPEDIDTLCFQVFIDFINTVGIQIQIRQMIHDFLIL